MMTEPFTLPYALIKRWALILTVLYALYALALYAGQRRLLFPGWGMQLPAPPATVERWSLGDARGYGLFVPGAEPAPSPLVVFAHGNGESAGDNLYRARAYAAEGYAVLLLEYRGYAGAGGAPSQEALVADSLALVERAVADPRVDPARVIYHGCSLGGGVLGQVARARPPQRLILESTFSSIRDIASRFLMPGLLVRDPFDTKDTLAALDVPTLIIHGDADLLVPYTHSLTNKAAARRAEHHRVEGGQHVLPAADTWPIIQGWLAR